MAHMAIGCKSSHSYPFLATNVFSFASIFGEIVSEVFLAGRLGTWGLGTDFDWSHLKNTASSSILSHPVASKSWGCSIQSSAAGGIAMFALLRQTGATRFRFGDPRKKIKTHSRRRWSQGAESGRKPAGFLHLHRQAAVCLVLRPLGWKRAKPQFKPAFCWNDGIWWQVFCQ